jgi:bis(5'-nucleosyl)-tetraphosphatase (symmetrical)
MPLYAVGDVQGCGDELLALLDRIRFDPEHDRLWFTGDLVNRGPRSTEVLRWVKRLGGRAVTVLGNHDLHLLAVAAGAAAPRPQDTLGDVLAAPDSEELLEWLRHRPLLHGDAALGYTLVHAGLLPSWGLDQARSLAAEVESALRGPDYRDFLAHLYGNQPDGWSDALRGWDRLRVITNALTRLRYCDAQGRMNLLPTGPPGSQPAGWLPWFQVPGRKSRGARIVFGHWSALGAWQGDGVIGLDSGCLWGRELTAARLDPDGAKFVQLPCSQHQFPHDE